MKIKITGNKASIIKQLIFDTLDILTSIGIPLENLTDRRLERIAMALLAVGNIKTNFTEALSIEDSYCLKTRDIINFENTYFEENISSGSYDDIRRKDLILLVAGDIVLNSCEIEAKATNNPTRAYGLNPIFAKLIKTYNTNMWDKELELFLKQMKSLKEKLKKNRKLQKMSVILPSGIKLELSYGEHNLLQKKIIEVFLSQFGFNSQILYIGDTSNKFLYKDEKELKKIKCFDIKHDELPDIIAYNKSKNLLFLIEAVHSTGAMSELRVEKLKKQLQKCTDFIIDGKI